MGGHRLWFKVLLVGLLLIASLLRLHHLDKESLWMDELYQVSFYSQPFDKMPDFASRQQQPPLDYFIGHLICRISCTDFGVRVPAAFFGVGTVLLVTLLAVKMCSPSVALATGLIAAALPFNIYFSQEARPYSIAIFFFLALIWSLDRFLSFGNLRNTTSLCLLTSTLAFLYSRAIEPLVVVTVLMLILLSGIVWHVRHHGIRMVNDIRLVIAALALLGAAVAVYLPTFSRVLERGARYLSDQPSALDLNTLKAGLERFDLVPLGLAFVFQTEPLTIPLVALLLYCPYAIWQLGLWSKGWLARFAILCLPGVSLLHLFIFQAKSTMPFKPQYAFYLLPLTLLLSAISFQGLWAAASKSRNATPLRFLIAVGGIALILLSATSVAAFKEIRKKEDWRGLTAYLARTYGPEQFLFFDTLWPYGGWKPTFFGFPRYYRGTSQLVSVDQLPLRSPEISERTGTPVLILYDWQGLTLLPNSLYGKMTGIGIDKGHGLAPLESSLEVRLFTGFRVITLRENEGPLAKDTYALIAGSLRHLPQDSSTISLYLAAASFARVLGFPDWEKHLALAQTLASEEQRVKMSRVIEGIRELPVKKYMPTPPP